MRHVWEFQSAGQLIFGPGACAQLGPVVRQLGLQRVLIVTDRQLVETGLVDRAEASLKDAGVTMTVFDGGQPEPSLEVGQSCVDHARRFGSDGIVGLGGGSNLDLAKAAAAVTAHGGAIKDYVGDGRVPGRVKPLVCLPTTAGTGSEVSFAAVLTDSDNQLKVPILSHYIRPSVAIVDPDLTLSCPPRVTADSGVDALTHAIEAYTAIDNRHFPLPPGERSVYQGGNPLSDFMAREAITRIGKHLERVVSDPANREARQEMALAATLAGLAFSNSGVALVHALQAAVGGATHSAHGAGNGLLLPHVMRFNAPQCRPRLAEIAVLLGEDSQGRSEEALAERAIETVQRLTRRVGIPQRLSDLGVLAEQIPDIAQKAREARRILRVNPRTPSHQEMIEILHDAL
jgi:alcohol dehydrogenase class IV